MVEIGYSGWYPTSCLVQCPVRTQNSILGLVVEVVAVEEQLKPAFGKMVPVAPRHHAP